MQQPFSKGLCAYFKENFLLYTLRKAIWNVIPEDIKFDLLDL